MALQTRFEGHIAARRDIREQCKLTSSLTQYPWRNLLTQLSGAGDCDGEEHIDFDLVSHNCVAGLLVAHGSRATVVLAFENLGIGVTQLDGDVSLKFVLEANGL